MTSFFIGRVRATGAPGRGGGELDEGRQTAAAENGSARARAGGRGRQRAATSQRRHQGHAQAGPPAQGTERFTKNAKLPSLDCLIIASATLLSPDSAVKGT